MKNKPYRKITDSMVDSARLLVRAGLDIERIADDFGVSKIMLFDSVHGIKPHRVRTPPIPLQPSLGRPRVTSTHDVAKIFFHRSKGRSIREIARRMGLKRSTVHRIVSNQT